jgi:hypothetical protein
MDHDHASRNATAAAAAAATTVYCFGCQVLNELSLAVFFWDELFQVFGSTVQSDRVAGCS